MQCGIAHFCHGALVEVHVVPQIDEGASLIGQTNELETYQDII